MGLRRFWPAVTITVCICVAFCVSAHLVGQGTFGSLPCLFVCPDKPTLGVWGLFLSLAWPLSTFLLSQFPHPKYFQIFPFKILIPGFLLMEENFTYWDMRNFTRNALIKPYIHTYMVDLIFNKDAKETQWEKDTLFNKWFWENWISMCKRINLDPYLTLIQTSPQNY